MNTSLEQLKAILSSLPAPERADLAYYLLHSLDSEEPGANAEWLVLAESRMEEVRSGHVVGIPAEEVLKNFLEPEQ